ncbi:MAG: cold shock domain-containing protein [Thermoleophilia bacterium]|nr:cold shock domain-containing protein [Thermoleophilia bacterium]
MANGTEKIIDAEGTVKWFDPKKGFGFIIGPEGQDVFVHYTRIEGEGFRVLKDGSRVRYDAEVIDKGWHASRVRRLDLDPAEDARRSRNPRR